MQNHDELDIGRPLDWRAFAALVGALLVLGTAVAFTFSHSRKTVEVFTSVCPEPVADINLEVRPDGRVAWNQKILTDRAMLLDFLAAAVELNQQPAVKIWFTGSKAPKIAYDVQADALGKGLMNVEILQKQRGSGRRQSL